MLAFTACREVERPRKKSSKRYTFEMRLVLDGAPPAGAVPMVLEDTKETIYVSPEAVITANDVKRARVQKGQLGEPTIAVSFKVEGANRLAAFTTANVGKRVALVVDGRVVSAPIIATPITEGMAVINGDFTKEEATQFAQFLSGD